jgi:O-acetyl-ADP-ribose deacetylase (regulator of RNase III)
MKTIKGDLLELADNGEFDVIVHGCNCFNVMGGGIARQIKERYPIAYEADCKTIRGDKFKLGKFSVANVGKFDIVNAYTQYNLRTSSDTVFEYEKFEHILDTLKIHFSEDSRFGFPLIGCGLAGADRNKIVELLENFANERNVTLVEFNNE